MLTPDETMEVVERPSSASILMAVGIVLELASEQSKAFKNISLPCRQQQALLRLSGVCKPCNDTLRFEAHLRYILKPLLVPDPETLLEKQTI